MPSTRSVAVTVASLGTALLLAACGTSDPAPTGQSVPLASGSTTPGADASSGAGTGTAATADLSADCPKTVVIQTDWNPQSEMGGLFQMLGPDPTIDSGKKRVTGTLMSAGQDTGVQVQIRAGGPAIGFQTVTSQMYVDDDITLGYTATDESAQLSAKQPTVAVIAPLNKSPQIIMWDPASHPDFTSIADIGKTDTKVRYFSGAVYMEYLVGAGILKRGQVDGSYDGTPANFVASGGKDTQQGYASAEPYLYEHEIKPWLKPVSYQLINDAGFPYYQAQLSVKAKSLDALRPCLKKLVPIIQQAQIDYVKSPDAVNSLILTLVGKYDTGWQYSAGVAKFSVEQQLKLGLVANGTDGVLGSIDEARVQKVLDIVKPIFVKQKTPVKEGLKATDLFTNEFLDPKITLTP